MCLVQTRKKIFCEQLESMIMRGGLRLLAILLFKMVFGVSGPIALSTNPIEKPPTIRGPDTCTLIRLCDRSILLSFNLPEAWSERLMDLHPQVLPLVL